MWKPAQVVLDVFNYVVFTTPPLRAADIYADWVIVFIAKYQKCMKARSKVRPYIDGHLSPNPTTNNNICDQLWHVDLRIKMETLKFMKIFTFVLVFDLNVT